LWAAIWQPIVVVTTIYYDNGRNSRKKCALEKWYDEHAIFGVEDDEGESFKQQWDDFWNHRHRIMHGSPDAYYDENVGIATLFFVGLTAHVVKERYDQLNQ
jgi:hypothetical protein